MDERNTFYPASPTSDGSLAVDDVYARPHKSAFTNGIDHHLNEPESARKRRSSKGRSKSRDRQELEIILLNEKVDTLRKELENERRQRNDELKNIQRTLQRVYQDCAALTSRDAEQLLELDNRVDSLSSRYRADHNDLNALKRRVETIEDVAALLRSRIEAIEQQPPQQKHHSTSTHDDVRNSLHRSGDASSTQSAWGAQIIWVISAARPNVFEVDGVAYLKLQSSVSPFTPPTSKLTSLQTIYSQQGLFHYRLQPFLLLGHRELIPKCPSGPEVDAISITQDVRRRDCQDNFGSTTNENERRQTLVTTMVRRTLHDIRLVGQASHLHCPSRGKPYTQRDQWSLLDTEGFC